MTATIDPHSVVHRLDELRTELASREEALRELDVERSRLVAGLVRLSGAVQALEDVLEDHSRASDAPMR